jgi:hypothetical protein
VVESVDPTRPATVETPPATNPVDEALAEQDNRPQPTEAGLPNPGIAIAEGWESRLKLVHYVGTGLVVLSGLGLVTLILLRRR